MSLLLVEPDGMIKLDHMEKVQVVRTYWACFQLHDFPSVALLEVPVKGVHTSVTWVFLLLCLTTKGLSDAF